MELIKSLDYIGYQGPIITSSITFLSLLGKPIYLFMFIIGSILNYSLNNEIKMMIKEPRPKNPLPFIDDQLIKGSQIYGMPSGHAQIVSFAITFLILTKGSIWLILPSLFIFSLTLIQRWKYRRHTVEQLIFGSFTGSFLSYVCFYFTDFYLQTRKNIKHINFFSQI